LINVTEMAMFSAVDVG